MIRPLVVTVPRIRAVTYLDLHSQLTVEQVWVQMVHLEQHVRCAITVAHYERSLDLTARFERLRRWMILIGEHRCRLALGARNQLQKAELHFRAGIMGYEGMAWPHLTLHLFTLAERCHRECILSMSKVEWRALQHTVFSIKAFSATMARFVRKQLATERRERQERNHAVHLFLLEAHFIAHKVITTELEECTITPGSGTWNGGSGWPGEQS